MHAFKAGVPCSFLYPQPEAPARRDREEALHHAVMGILLCFNMAARDTAAQGKKCLNSRFRFLFI